MLLVALINSPSAVLPSQGDDWLIHPQKYGPTSFARWPNGNGYTLGNGLIERSFFTRDGLWCSGLAPSACRSDLFPRPDAEANFSSAIRAWVILALLTLANAMANLTATWRCLTLTSCCQTCQPTRRPFSCAISTANPSALYEWTPGRFGAPADIPWPPKGLHLAVDFVPPAGAPAALRGIVATVHYEMYDGLATLRKWVSVVNHASRTKPGIRDGGKDQLDGKDEGSRSVGEVVIVETLHYELLRAPNWAPEYMTVMRQQANNPTPFDQQVPVPDEKHGQAPPIGATFTLWHTDPKYDQLHDQELHVPYTPYTLLAVGYTDSNIYGGPTGPGAPLPPDGSAFESLSVRLTLHDSTEVERMGLGVRQMLRLLAPAINESPVLAMLDDASSSHSIRTFVDQLSETGHELAIIGFGAKGWCGMCLDQLRNATFRAWLRDEVAYATSRGVTLSAYTLMQLNGWGESGTDEARSLNRDGTRGPTACFHRLTQSIARRCSISW